MANRKQKPGDVTNKTKKSNDSTETGSEGIIMFRYNSHFSDFTWSFSPRI